MKYYFSVIINEFLFILKNKRYLFLILLFPVIDFMLMGSIYLFGNVTDMPVAVIDKDNSKISRTITRYFNSSSSFQIAYRLNNVTELRDLMIENKVYMGIYIPKNTQNDIKKLKSATVISFINSANYLTSNIAELESSAVISTVNAGLKNTMLKKKGIQKNQADALTLQIKNDTSKLFNPTYNYGFFLTPGLWISVVFQILILLSGLTVSRELEFNTFKPENIFIYIIGKITVYAIISVFYFEILFRLFFPVFQIPFNGNTSNAVILSILFALSTILLGMTLATLLKNRIDTLKGCLLIGAPAFLLSGYTWPADQMPAVIQSISFFIPLTKYLEGFRKIFQQNLPYEYIFPFVKALSVLLILYFIITYTGLNIRNRILNKKQ